MDYWNKIKSTLIFINKENIWVRIFVLHSFRMQYFIPGMEHSKLKFNWKTKKKPFVCNHVSSKLEVLTWTGDWVRTSQTHTENNGSCQQGISCCSSQQTNKKMGYLCVICRCAVWRHLDASVTEAYNFRQIIGKTPSYFLKNNSITIDLTAFNKWCDGLTFLSS